MRGLLIAIVLAATAATAGEAPSGEDPATERRRYIAESLTVCRERVALIDQWICDDAAVGGAYLWDAERRGRFTDQRFQVDRDAGGAEELKRIAWECRLATMDGELIDGLSAAACIVRGVQEVNREARRARRGTRAP